MLTGRSTEHQAARDLETDQWMQRRIRYFGEPCLTTREYQAVVYSLFGLPAYAFDENKMNHGHTIERPTQRYIASKMRISPGRVSQLLKTAARAIHWFAAQGRADEVRWVRQGKSWHFVAPMHDAPKGMRIASVRIVKDRASRSYKLAFAGELN